MTRLDGRFNPALPGAVVVELVVAVSSFRFLSTTHQPLAVA